MEVKYRIILVDPSEHSIVVRYFTDKVTEEMLATEFDANNKPVLTEEGFPTRCRTDYHINIFQVPSPSEEEIVKIIDYNAPYDWLNMQEQIKDPEVDTSLSNVTSMINTVGTAVKPSTIIQDLTLPPNN
jgi:hypothetical protein